jgi:hypothetical protein
MDVGKSKKSRKMFIAYRVRGLASFVLNVGTGRRRKVN